MFNRTKVNKDLVDSVKRVISQDKNQEQQQLDEKTELTLNPRKVSGLRFSVKTDEKPKQLKKKLETNLGGSVSITKSEYRNDEFEVMISGLRPSAVEKFQKTVKRKGFWKSLSESTTVNDDSVKVLTEEDKSYPVSVELSIPERANPRFGDLSTTEIDKRGGVRIIGGDQGDLHFKGYTVERDRTVLDDPELVTNLDLSQDEVDEIAQEVLAEAYQSVGVEVVESKNIKGKTINEAEKGSDEKYEKLVNKLLNDFGVNAPDELDDDEKKEFFNKLDDMWNSDEEPGPDGTDDDDVKDTLGEAIKDAKKTLTENLSHDDLIQQFRDEILPIVQDQYERDGQKDIPARREAWNEWLDSLEKDGIISRDQVDDIGGLPDIFESKQEITEKQHYVVTGKMHGGKRMALTAPVDKQTAEEMKVATEKALKNKKEPWATDIQVGKANKYSLATNER